MNNYTRCFVLFFFAFAKAITPFAQAQSGLMSNGIVEAIPLKLATDESYALYLGNGYTPNTSSPVLFVFAPDGNGKNGIKPFVKAADDLGMIVVSSNNSKNGPYERNFEYAQHLFTEILSAYNVDEKAIYLAGFSGGARLATAIACLTPNIKGVIAIGAGFSNDPTHIPSTQGFDYVGVSGDRDFNYLEMVGVQDYLKKTGIRNCRLHFEGGHQWPPKELMQHAFRWFMMKEQRRSGNAFGIEEVKSFYIDDLRKGDELVRNNKLLDAFQWYEHLNYMYSGLVSQSSLENSLKKLKKRKSYKRQLKERQKAFSIEREMIKTLVGRFWQDYVKPSQVDYNWWAKEINSIKEFKSRPGAYSQMSTRLSWTLYANAASTGNPNLYTQNEEQKKFCERLIEMLKTKEN